jgi:putative transposase
MDFVSDRLLHGRVFRALTLLDESSRYSLALQPEFSYPSASVVRTLKQVARDHGYPDCLRVDNGPEFIATALEMWAHEHTVELLFIQPGKPTQNAFIESFNSRVRDELLMMNRFRTIFEARAAAESWRNEYNRTHSYSSPGGMTPEEFLARYEIAKPPQKSLAA